MTQPLIIYVPGLLPKPEASQHRQALLRCLLAGIARIDADLARRLGASSRSFDLIAWTYDFYREHSDFSLESAGVERLIEQNGPSARDIAEATSWTRRLTRWLYRLGDRMPFLIPHIASERMELHLRDLHRYIDNENGIAEHTRRMLKVPLLAAAGAGRPILLIGHSMGSVIAYDALWQLSREHGNPVTVDCLLTMGSPLGQRYIQERLLGASRQGADRYPSNIRHWRNVSAVGDLTAINPYLAGEFGEMSKLGLLQSIEDRMTRNWYRYEGHLNAHSEYGYLVNEETARTVVDWWRGHYPS